jgi:hypothetical protein
MTLPVTVQLAKLTLSYLFFLITMFHPKVAMTFATALISGLAIAIGANSSSALASDNLQPHHKTTLGSSSLHIAASKDPYAGQAGKKYTATTILPCSINNAKHDQNCPAAVIRKKNGSGTVFATFPDGKEIQYEFTNCPYDDLKNCKITGNTGNKLDWGFADGQWSVGIDGKYFIVIIDAVLYGG